MAERRTQRAAGLAWCRYCEAWLPISDVRGGMCREHRNADYRTRYKATGGKYKRGVASARRRGVGVVPFDVREDLFATTGGLCAYGCDRPATALDHVIPVAQGGLTVPGNMVPACTTCNSRKRDSDPWPWINQMTLEAIDLVSPHFLYDGAVMELIERDGIDLAA